MGKNMLNKYTEQEKTTSMSHCGDVWICVRKHVFGTNTFCIIKAQSDVISIWRSVDFLKYKQNQEQQIQMNFPMWN